MPGGRIVAGVEKPPSCALTRDGLERQRRRYRAAGEAAGLVERSALRLRVDFNDAVDLELIDQLVAVERECCPFFEIDWKRSARRMQVDVASEHRRALDAVASNFGF